MIRQDEYIQRYCSEPLKNIENYDEAVNGPERWELHHRLEVQGQFTNSAELLKKCGMYYNVPAWQLIFLKPTDHRALHNANRSDETKNKVKDYWASHKHPNFGRTFSDGTRNKMSAAHKGDKNSFFGKHHSKNSKRKISEARLGKILVNNGTEMKFVCPDEIPDGFVRGRLKI